VGTAFLGCPAERSSAACFRQTYRAALGWADEDVRPYVVLDGYIDLPALPP
jgi:hypothetical protein